MMISYTCFDDMTTQAWNNFADSYLIGQVVLSGSWPLLKSHSSFASV